MLAPRALVDMPAERGRPTERQFRQHTLNLRHRLIAIPRQIFRRGMPQQVAYAEGFARSLSGEAGFGLRSGSLFAGLLGNGSWFGSIQRGHWRTGNQPSGLGIDSKWGRRTCR